MHRTALVCMQNSPCCHWQEARPSPFQSRSVIHMQPSGNLLIGRNMRNSYDCYPSALHMVCMSQRRGASASATFAAFLPRLDGPTYRSSCPGFSDRSHSCRRLKDGSHSLLQCDLSSACFLHATSVRPCRSVASVMLVEYQAKLYSDALQCYSS
jgi:hypothetical protein